MKKLTKHTNILARLSSFMKRYTMLILFFILSGMYGFLAYRINTLTQAEPSDEAVTEKLKTVPRPRIDKADIVKMQKLEKGNVEVKTLFEDARKNPFTE